MSKRLFALEDGSASLFAKGLDEGQGGEKTPREAARSGSRCKANHAAPWSRKNRAGAGCGCRVRVRVRVRVRARVRILNVKMGAVWTNVAMEGRRAGDAGGGRPVRGGAAKELGQKSQRLHRRRPGTAPIRSCVDVVLSSPFFRPRGQLTYGD